MASFENDLAKYESPLGAIQGATLKQWYKHNPKLDEAYTKLITEPTLFGGRYTPSGYIHTGQKEGNKKVAIPVKNQMISIIVALAKCVFEKRFSYREVEDAMQLVGIKLSYTGWRSKVLPRYAETLGISEIIPTSKGQLRHITSIADAERAVKLENERFAKRVRREGLVGEEVNKALAEERGVEYKAPKAPSEKPKIKLSDEGRQIIDGKEIIYRPTPKQELFHQAAEKVVLYGGAAGGGKSFALIFDAVRYAHVPRYRAVIIRRTMPELMELIETSKEYYSKLFPGAKYNTQKNMWRFPSGAIVEFGYLDKPNDKLRYQGQQYQYIAFDELGQWPDPEGWNYLKSRLRKPPIDPMTGKPIPTLMRATSNPGALWVKEMFIDAAPHNTTFYVGPKGKQISHRFIPATLYDNQHLDEDYELMLHSLPEMERRQLLYGDWNATDSAAFPEFRPEGTYQETKGADGKVVRQCLCKPHVIAPFEIPKWWNRICGMDYGYRDPAVAVWYAVNPDNGQKVVYKEIHESGLTGTEFGMACRRMEEDEIIPIDHVLDWAAFNRTGASGPTVGEEIRRSSGLALRPADKNRKAGKVQIHEALRPLPNSTEPGIVFFDTCENIIGQLKSAQIKPNDPDDIDQTRIGESHKHHWDAYDALRYGLMARPTRQNRADMFKQAKQRSRWSMDEYFN